MISIEKSYLESVLNMNSLQIKKECARTSTPIKKNKTKLESQIKILSDRYDRLGYQEDNVSVRLACLIKILNMNLVKIKEECKKFRIRTDQKKAKLQLHILSYHSDHKCYEHPEEEKCPLVPSVNVKPKTKKTRTKKFKKKKNKVVVNVQTNPQVPIDTESTKHILPTEDEKCETRETTSNLSSSSSTPNLSSTVHIKTSSGSVLNKSKNHQTNLLETPFVELVAPTTYQYYCYQKNMINRVFEPKEEPNVLELWEEDIHFEPDELKEILCEEDYERYERYVERMKLSIT